MENIIGKKYNRLLVISKSEKTKKENININVYVIVAIL